MSWSDLPELVRRAPEIFDLLDGRETPVTGDDGNGSYHPHSETDRLLHPDTLRHLDRRDIPSPETREAFDGVDRVSGADLDLDPNGQVPIDRDLETALVSDTIVTLEPGTYRLAGEITVSDRENVGVEAPEGATIRLDTGTFGYRVRFGGCENVLLSGIEFDQSREPVSAQVALNVTGNSVVEDVSFTGYSDPFDSGKKIAFNVRDPKGTIAFRRCEMTDGTMVGRSGVDHNDVHKQRYDGGMWAGPNHTGTAFLLDCEIAHWSDNGLYASRTNGGVVVDGGRYANSSISQVRLGHPDSFVGGGVEIEVDRATIPEANNPRGLAFTRGIWLESGGLNNAGATIGETTIRIGDVDAFGGAINVASSARDAYIVGPVTIYAPDGVRTLVTDADVVLENGAITRK